MTTTAYLSDTSQPPLCHVPRVCFVGLPQAEGQPHEPRGRVHATQDWAQRCGQEVTVCLQPQQTQAQAHARVSVSVMQPGDDDPHGKATQINPSTPSCTVADRKQLDSAIFIVIHTQWQSQTSYHRRSSHLRQHLLDRMRVLRSEPNGALVLVVLLVDLGVQCWMVHEAMRPVEAAVQYVEREVELGKQTRRSQ